VLPNRDREGAGDQIRLCEKSKAPTPSRSRFGNTKKNAGSRFRGRRSSNAVCNLRLLRGWGAG
jgi:hypothetical protein